jgi:hypothetical protein
MRREKDPDNIEPRWVELVLKGLSGEISEGSKVV